MNNAVKMLLAKNKYRECAFPLDEACHDIVSLRSHIDTLIKDSESLKKENQRLTKELSDTKAKLEERK